MKYNAEKRKSIVENCIYYLSEDQEEAARITKALGPHIEQILDSYNNLLAESTKNVSDWNNATELFSELQEVFNDIYTSSDTDDALQQLQDLEL